MPEPRDTIVAAQAYLAAAYISSVSTEADWDRARPSFKEKKLEIWPWPDVPFTPYRKVEDNLAQVATLISQAQLFARREYDS